MSDDSNLKQLLALQAVDAVFVHEFITGTSTHETFIDVNDVACEWLEYTREELLTMRPVDIDANPDSVPNRQNAILREEGIVVFQRTLITKSGELIPVEICSHLLSVGDTQLSFSICRDISDRVHREEERTLNEQRFKTLYELSQKIDDPEQEILDYALEESVRMTKSTIGYIYLMNAEETELTLHAWSKNVMKECSINNFPEAYKVSETGLWGEAARQRKPIITNDYESCPTKRGYPEGHVPVKRHMNLPIIDDGRIVIIAGVGNREDEYTEADVVQLTLIMEGMWRIIQRKKIEKDLVLTRQAAERANEAKSQFLANMSHELRTPLNGIMGMTQILLGTDITPEQAEYLNLSLDSSRHLTKVLTDLLDLSIIESGGINLTPTNFNLRDTLEVLVKPIVLQAADKELILTLEIAEDVPGNINGDAGKLRQILINLLFNAIKFTDNGEISLIVTRTNASKGLLGNMSELRFTVADTGIGISPDLHESIFDSFILGEDYLTKQQGGTGLGLSISRQLVEIMGGKIGMESTLGIGSTFHFTAPFIMRESTETICTTPGISIGKDIGSLTILLAEDEQINAIAASRMLKKAGHSVTIVGNGQHAIDALVGNQFDLVLMDVQMPVINGIQATEIIRSGAAEGVPRDMPIIGLTAFARDSERQQFLDAGMQCVVTKPFELAELMRAIAATVSN